MNINELAVAAGRLGPDDAVGKVVLALIRVAVEANRSVQRGNEFEKDARLRKASENLSALIGHIPLPGESP